MRRILRSGTLGAVLAASALAIPAGAQERCRQAALPSDRLPSESCDGCPTDAPDALFRTLARLTDEETVPIPHRKLAAIAAEELRDALSKGYDVGSRFRVGDHASIGAETGIGAILGEQQTDLQRSAAADGAVWLRHTVKAEAGANLGSSVPVGPHGFFVRTGLGAGANFGVRVDRRYDPRTARAARDAVVNHLKIPFAASDAAELRPGERVVISGNGNVAVSGGAGYGADLGSIVNGVNVGATASAGTARVLSGAFETEVRREENDVARVTLRTGRSDDASHDLNVFAGIAVDHDAFEIPLDTGIHVLDAAIEDGARGLAREAERVLSASFTARRGNLDSVGALQEYTFDLKRRQARRAYEDSLRGDFRAAAELAACGGAGVGFVREVNDTLDRTYREARLAVSLLRYSVAATSSDARKTIRDAAGNRSFDLYNYTYDRRGFFGSTARVNVGAVHAMRGALGADGKSVHLTYEGEMENRHFTSRGEMKDLVRIGTAMAPDDFRSRSEMERILDSPRSGLSLPSFMNYYGRTRMRLDLTVSQGGIERIARASEEELWAAFAAPHRDAPLWATAEGRRDLQEHERWRHHDDHRNSNIREDYWLPSYQRVRDAVGSLRQLGATEDENVRARLLRDAAEAMGNDFTAGAALAILSGDRDRAVSYSIKNEHNDYTWTQIGDRSTVAAVE